jgi:hypothetical protein
MYKRMTDLEAALAPKPRKAKRTLSTAVSDRAHNRAVKAEAKARKAQFKLEAQKRARLHCTLNRYYL